MEARDPAASRTDEPSANELARRLYAQRQARFQPRATHQRVIPTHTKSKRSDQQQAKTETLALQVAMLQTTVEQLVHSRDLLLSQQLNRFDDDDGSSVKAVHEYFRVLKRGVILSSVDAVEYLSRAMADDVQTNSFVGREVVVEQWKTHSMCWGAFEVCLVDTLVIPLTPTEAMVRCTARYALTISRLSLAMVFPHILQSSELVQSLLGRQVEGIIRQDFVYDRELKQFTRLEVVMDLLTAFSSVIRRPERLVRLFQGALLTDEFYAGEVDPTVARSPTWGQANNRVEAGSDEQGQAKSETVAKEDCRPSATKMRLDHIL